MRKLDGKFLYSATDLCNFGECRHHLVLDLQDQVTPLPKTEQSEEAALYAAKGDAHEKAYLEKLRAQGLRVAEIEKGPDFAKSCEATCIAMKQGADVIFQAAIHDDTFGGYIDFLQRVEQPSNLGAYSYEVADTKLARQPKVKFLIQVGLYSDLIAQITGRLPERMHLVLGNGEQVSYRVADYVYYLRQLREDFRAFVASPPKDTYPLPCAFCALCVWQDGCEQKRVDDDHLCGVAGMSRSATQKLERASIKTIKALAQSPDSQTVPTLANATLAKLRAQARMQVRGREAGKPLFEYRKDVEAGKGFARMPAPDEGDVFFDFEGDPLFDEDGLEYLFGVGYVDNGKFQFKPLWAHDRAAERAAFSEFVQWLRARIERHPNLHVYHYAPYEPAALRRLMSLHGVHEADVDQFLREHRLVDLYQVVREALVISEPRYSLKNVEKFFMPARTGDVVGGAGSIVWYERWRETREQQLLDQICDYNRFDLESTGELVTWLRKIAKDAPAIATVDFEVQVPATDKSDKIKAHEDRLAQFESALLGAIDKLPADDQRFRHLVFSLLDFHRRADKPAWWALFDRPNQDLEQLLDDTECIADCRIAMPAQPKSHKEPYVFSFPTQDTKLRAGKQVYNAADASYVGTIEELDDNANLVTIKCAKKAFPLPEHVDLCAGGPINSDSLRDALFRFAESVVANDGRFGAVRDLLHRHAPRLQGRTAGTPIVASQSLDDALAALLAMRESVLFIQGPPGCGKTHSSSWLIVELIDAGYRVGVASNSHKAINHLLAKCEERAIKKGIKFAGFKKSSANDDESEFNGKFITSDAGTPLDLALDSGYKLVAGTAWFYAGSADKPLDYLFIDEAGQVSLANTVVMGLATKNLVLVGDQMQLNQPIQGVHPGHSGDSALEYLLDGHATVATDRGILLETTWRLHPSICQFISDAVYDGRLVAHEKNAKQRILLDGGADPRLKPAGLAYVPVQHDGCSQKSEAEADLIKTMYENLLKQRYVDDEGVEHAMTSADILVVAPYNVQVNLLKQRLPAGARVGTVDKFQGQEAEVVLISMATSNSESVPRSLDFLFSRNRLNVAISRARCLSVLVCSPDLPRIACSTPEQMTLVNTLAWFVETATSTIPAIKNAA